ncbi:MAG: hypothetical protein CBC42_07605 [Betaproteobacteria bacterium TMED82]|nr:MAG: hypothetical protein CBC42_07605 [Betaproteobacteria bacterium TMED82]|tara:strand:- start:56182 stop:57495 length:1314 start_codon:yes stop_codon:yes gene_type:complete
MENDEFTALKIRELMINGNISVNDFFDSLINRLSKVNSINQLSCLFDKEYVLRQVNKLSELRKSGVPGGRLFGVPFVVSGDVKTELQNHLEVDIPWNIESSSQATIVRRLIMENAILLGQNYPSDFKNLFLNSDIKNPYNPKSVIGGVSSYAAFVVCCGLVPVSVTSQFCGCVISNALNVGIYGYRPTREFTPLTGMKIFSHTLDKIGLLGRNIIDLASLSEIIFGDDGNDIVSNGVSRQQIINVLNEDRFGKIKLLLFKSKVMHEPDSVHRENLRLLKENIDCEIVEMEFEHAFSGIAESFDNIYYSELAANFSHFSESDETIFNSALKKKLTLGKATSAFDYLSSFKLREKFDSFFNDIFEDFDGILTFVEPNGKREANATVEDEEITKIWDFFGMPALGIPVSNSKSPVPEGIQIVGKKFNDAKLFRLAKELTL